MYRYNNDNVSSDSNSDTDSDDDLERVGVNVNLPIEMKEDSLNFFIEHFMISSDSKDRKLDTSNTTFNYKIERLNCIHKNINSISVLGVIVPNIYLDTVSLHGLVGDNIISSNIKGSGLTSTYIRPQRLSDLKYITLKVNNFDSSMDGSNTQFFKSTITLVLDGANPINNNSGFYHYHEDDDRVYEISNIGKHSIAESPRENLVFKPIDSFTKEFDTPLASLFSMSYSFFDPMGNPLKLMSDKLTIKNIQVNANKFRITTNEYFSPEEYSVGDSLKFSDILVNVSLPTVREQNLIDFLLSDTKVHTILGFGSANSYNLYNSIDIGFKYSFNKTTGVIDYEEFNLTGQTLTFSNGNILNKTLQNNVIIDISTKRSTSDSMKARII